jgi:ribosomal protein L9
MERTFHAPPTKMCVNGQEFIVGVMPWVPYSDEAMKELTEEYEKQRQEKIKQHEKVEQSMTTKQVEVVSNSDPNKKYHLTIYADGKIECDCKGFQFRRDCSHVKKYKESMK